MSRYDEFPFPGLPSIQELTDASNECRHGRLPFDPGPRCICWHNINWQPKVSRVRAVEMYAAGATSTEVAARFGVSADSVLRWSRAAGVAVRRQGTRSKAA